jgi:integrase/recombinase XerD
MSSDANFSGLVQAFFTDRLLRQRRASPHTVAGYRDTFRLLLRFAKQRLGKAPSKLSLTDLDAPFVGDFLDHLE